MRIATAMSNTTTVNKLLHREVNATFNAAVRNNVVMKLLKILVIQEDQFTNTSL